eukprot:scaffold22410_cov34-Cyclotella_meneghiniana.AAC.2
MFLTHTPVQNSPKELMSLLSPLLSNATLSKTKSKGGFDSDDEKGGDGGCRRRRLFAPFVLRRKKSDVLSQIMPPKTPKVDLVDMDEATNRVYKTILSNAMKGGADTVPDI